MKPEIAPRSVALMGGRCLKFVRSDGENYFYEEVWESGTKLHTLSADTDEAEYAARMGATLLGRHIPGEERYQLNDYEPVRVDSNNVPAVETPEASVTYHAPDKMTQHVKRIGFGTVHGNGEIRSTSGLGEIGKRR